jgi:hypothetical protein
VLPLQPVALFLIEDWRVGAAIEQNQRVFIELLGRTRLGQIGI